MKLGIDFGTTRIVVARADRGNYPVLTFESPDGEVRDFIPSLVAVSSTELRYGWEAWEVSNSPGWTVFRSLKRILETAGPDTQIDFGPQQISVKDVLGGFAAAIRSSLDIDEPLEVMVGVPANSNSNQRYLTAEAFQQAGFQVLGLLNEPSAAGIEYGNAVSRKTKSDELLLIYDLGGGTFDASLVEVTASGCEILASEGISTLGGDDFDGILADMAVSEEKQQTLTQQELFFLHEVCRESKEALHANSRRILMDLDLMRPGSGSVTISVADYFSRCKPLVDETIHAVNDLLSTMGSRTLDCLYITGGGSEIPLVARMLRENFGRRVKRSAYTRAATAIGLAVHADGQFDGAINEKFTRYFGVWREANEGKEIRFDPVFYKGTSLPGTGMPPLKEEREYTPTHNIGHFRYLEASAIDSAGRPVGDITLWDEILFPFDPALEKEPDLRLLPVQHCEQSLQQRIRETWLCNVNGAVEVILSNQASGFEKRYRLGRWNSAEPVVKPANGKRRKSKI